MRQLTKFRKTTIGEIPEEWKLSYLSDICTVVRDGSHFSPEHRVEGYPLATVVNMRSNYIDIDSCYKIDNNDFDLLVKNGCKLETGDVLFSKDGTVGLSLVYTQDTPIVVLSSIAFMRPELQLVDSLFLSYALQSGNVIDRVMASRTGTALKRIILKDLRRIHVPLPPVQEQRRITSILSKVDELIQKTDQIILQTQRLMKGLMQKLFTTGTGSTKSKVDFVTLGDYVEVKGRIGWRGLKRHEYVESGPYMISGYNLINRIIMWNKCLHISDFRYDESPEIQLKLNDVIMVKDGVTLGRVGFIDYLPGPTTINSTLVLIRDLSGKFFPEFLFYYFQGPIFQNIIKERVSGLAVPHIFQRDIKGLKIPILELVEQKRIASMLSQLDKYYEKQIEISNLNKNLKKGLMQKLLTGQIRV